MSHFVYMLRCKGDRIYTGYAVDVEARFQKHQEGKAAHFTTAFPPLELLGSIEVPDKSTGLRLEAAIKALPRTDKDKLVRELRSLSSSR